MFNFANLVSQGRNYAAAAGGEFCFLFTEVDQNGNCVVQVDYPSDRVKLDPETPLPPYRADNWAGDRGSGYEELKPILDGMGFTTYGLFRRGVLVSGVGNILQARHWPAKGIAAVFAISTGPTLDELNADLTSGIAFIRTFINESDGDNHPLAPNVPFTSGQVTDLQNWLDDHGITPQEFAALFDISAAQVASWLQSNPRWKFAKQIHDRFT